MKRTASMTRRSLAPYVILALVLAAPAAFMPRAAHGQGTNGMLPNPISSRDLAGYADRLNLTEQQRREIDPLHEQYREAFRELRATDIEAFMQTMGGMGGGWSRMLDREAIEDSAKQLNQVMAKIQALDNRLFNDLQTVLSDDQVAGLAAVKQVRKRQRYSSGATRLASFVNRAAQVDLSRLYGQLDLTTQQRTTTEPFVLQYEGRLTSAAKDLYEATTGMFLDVFDSLEEQGIQLDNLADGDARRRLMPAMMTAWSEAMKKPRDKASAVSDLNRSTLRQLTELLPAEPATNLRDRYLRRAYPEVPRVSQGAARRSYEAALRLDGLSDRMRQDIQATADEFRATQDKKIDGMLNFIDDYRREFAPMNFRRGNRQEHQEKVQEYREQLAALDREAVEALYALLGPDLAEHVQAAVAKRQSIDIAESGRDVTMVGGGGMGAMRIGQGIGQVSDSDAAILGPDPFLPQPITRRQITAYSERLGLPENDRFILQTLHEDYAASFSVIRNTDIQALQNARRRLQPANPEGENAPPPTPEQIDAVYSLRQRALAAILDLEDSLFDDIEETLISTEEQLQTTRRLRSARQRVVYNRGAPEDEPGASTGRRGRRGRPSFMRGFGGQSRESHVDLARLLDTQALSEQDRTKAAKLLLEYEAEAAEAFRLQYEQTLRLRREREKATAQAAARPREGGNQDARTRWRALRQVSEEYGRRAQEAAKVIVDLNRATLSTLTEALSDAAGQSLRRAYNRQAFPSVYNDRSGAQRYLTTALKIRDLNEAQGAEIGAIIREYTPAYERLSNQMAEVHASAPDATGTFDRSAWQGFQQRRNQLEVLRFDRDEVDAMALRRLREVLTEQQAAQIGLPDEEVPEEENARRGRPL